MICTLSNLGTVSAASWDYTKYKEELFSLHMQDATATFSSNPKCFCKQCYPQTAAAAAAVVECWQLWITVKAVQSLHGNNDIITLCAKFGKFYCVWMSQVVQNKSSRWIENWRIWDKSVCDVSFPDCAQTSVVSNIRLWNTIVSIKTMRC